MEIAGLPIYWAVIYLIFLYIAYGKNTIIHHMAGKSSTIDPDILQSAHSLQGIHGQLRDIFAKAREKAAAFRYPKMKTAFDRELMAGIDGVGRAHAIILPTAQGAEEDDQ